MSEKSTPPDRRTFLQGVAMGAAACAMGDIAAEASPASLSPSVRLLRVGLEAVGIAPAGASAFVEAVNAKVGGLHSFMLLRHGKVAAEAWWTPYAPASPHMLYSLSKSFTSTAAGLAVSEGLFSVEDAVTSFFPDSLPATISDNLAAMRVRHLLTMNTGHDKDATGGTTSQPDGDWVRGFLALPVEHTPGSKFVYNSAATYMLSAIVQRRSGKTVLDYLTPRLFVPLGIENPTWETCPKGINTGGWGLSVKTEDIARFGQTYLQKGQWNGRQVVPVAWVEQATMRQVPNGDPALPSDWSQGYGYQFWRCRHNAYRGDGAFGQYCLVMPDHDAVLAITSGVGDMQAVLNAVWEHLLPAMGTAPLPADSKTDTDLQHKLKTLAIPVPQGQPTSPTVARVSGKTFRFGDNGQKLESLTLTFDAGGCQIVMRDAKGEQRVTCGSSRWVKGAALLEGALSSKVEAKVMARGTWTQDDTYTATLCFMETPYVRTLICAFGQDQMTLRIHNNVSFGPTDTPSLVGHLA